MSIQIIHRPYKKDPHVAWEINNVNPRNVLKAFKEMSKRFRSETISRGSVGRGGMWVKINGVTVDVVDENEMYWRMSDVQYRKLSGTPTEFAKKLIEERS